MQDLEAARLQLDATDKPDALLALATAIRRQFGSDPDAELVAIQALTKWMRSRRDSESELDAEIFARRIDLMAEVCDARSLQELLARTAQDLRIER